MVQFERGQVWMIRSKSKTINPGREQGKDRPWLVLSIGKFNKSSGMITCAPLTSREDVRTPSQVLMVNNFGRSNVILCEQIKTFDISSGEYLYDYMGQVSTEILEKVDVALSIHLGMHYSPITLQKLYDSMEAIIKSVSHMQAKENTPKFTDDDVIQFAEKLGMLATQTNNEISATIEYDEPKVITPKIEVKEKESSSEEIQSKPVRIRWTKENCEQFMHDANTLPMKDVMAKWNILKKTRFYTTKNYVQGLLMKKM